MESLDFNKYYDKKEFDWVNSDLYHFLCRYYGLEDVLLETCYGMVLVKKYNVVGYNDADDFITIYESSGELDKPLWRVYLSTIYHVEVLY